MLASVCQGLVSCLFVCGLLFGYLLFFICCLFVYCCFCLFVNWYTMFDCVTRDLFLEQVCVKGLPVVFTDEPCIGLIGRQGKGTSSLDTKTEVIKTYHSLMIVYMPKKIKDYSANKFSQNWFTTSVSMLLKLRWFAKKKN